MKRDAIDQRIIALLNEDARRSNRNIGRTLELSEGAVRQRIRQMIDEEDPENVLSDDSIVDQLRKADIVVARRTVAKYREAMRIPSSVERRRRLKEAC